MDAGQSVPIIWFNLRPTIAINSQGSPLKTRMEPAAPLSSAIAAFLAQGVPLDRAVQKAIDWLHGAVQAADQLSVGQGHGPVHHFYKFWQ